MRRPMPCRAADDANVLGRIGIGPRLNEISIVLRMKIGRRRPREERIRIHPIPFEGAVPVIENQLVAINPRPGFQDQHGSTLRYQPVR